MAQSAPNPSHAARRRNRITHPLDAQRAGDALKRIATAGNAVKASKRDQTAHNELQSAVDEGRAIGLGWTAIGAVLHIASGNAYQRYRTHPQT